MENIQKAEQRAEPNPDEIFAEKLCANKNYDLVMQLYKMDSKHYGITLVRAHEGMLRYILRAYFSKYKDRWDDLMQEAKILLLNHADNFDLKRGIAFSRYALHSIKKELAGKLNEDRLVKIAESTELPYRKYHRDREYLAADLGVGVEDAQIETIFQHEFRGHSSEDIKIYHIIDMLANICSLSEFVRLPQSAFIDPELTDEEEVTWQQRLDQIADDTNLFDQAYSSGVRENFYRVLEKVLSKNIHNENIKKKVSMLLDYFGLKGDGSALTLPEIATKYHCSRQNADQVIVSGLKRIRKALARDAYFQDYLEGADQEFAPKISRIKKEIE